MTVAGRLEGADPADLDGLREALGLADPEGRLTPIGMRRIEIGAEAFGSPDRPDYVIERLGDLLPREDECRAAVQTPDKRNL